MKIFNQLAAKRPPSNKFDLTHEKKLSCNMGDLIPVMCQEVVPGDKFRGSSEIFLRMAPMLSPIMHRVNVYVHYFFVPNRLVWQDWEMFITRGRNGEQAPVQPHFTMNEVLGSDQAGLLGKGTLWDYMGGKPVTGPSVVDNKQISVLPFRAYQKIWDDYYRDPTLTNPLFQPDVVGGNPILPISSGSIGVNTTTIYNTLGLRARAWEKDYFTSAQPNAQRGADVQIPIEGLDVNYKPASDYVGNISGLTGSVAGNAAGDLVQSNPTGQNEALRIENIESIEGYGLTVNELRTTLALQKWFEKNARAGYRYIEQILSHFGVTSSDARLQRAEYLGGGKVPVKISEVLSTFGVETSVESPNITGEMYGHGTSFGSTNRFQSRFEEHGFIIGVMSILPRTNYQDGLPRFLTTRNTWDKYYWPEFANLGEQEVLNHELYWDPADATANNDAAFGYQSRYVEYKYGISTVHGDMRDTLDYWHMGRKFSARPNLNAAFVQADPTQRIFNVTDPAVHKIYCHILNKVDAIRPMPYFGVPTI